MTEAAEISAGRERYQEFPCDLCGATEAVELPHCRELTRGEPIHICTRCGFVYVKRRRSARRIAEVWSEEIFGSGYTARLPAVTARLTYVAELLDVSLGLAGKRVCEIGAGEGEFLDIVRGPKHGAEPFGIEPSEANCELLARAGIPRYHGTIEEYCETPEAAEGAFDLVAILWTLENCQSCREMLRGARRLLKDGGSVVVATGSRILVPFKKPLHTYLSANPADTHAFRFSARTLQGILAVCDLEVTHVNRFIDHDVLCAIARKREQGARLPWKGDDYLDVYSFFERWYADTRMYFPPES